MWIYAKIVTTKDSGACLVVTISRGTYAGIAQLVEHLPEEQRVPSSSLGPSTEKLKHPKGCFNFSVLGPR